MLRKSFTELAIVRRDFFLVFILLFNAFSWLYVTLRQIIPDILSSPQVGIAQSANIHAIYFGAIIGSSIAGSILSSRIRRSTLLSFWMIFGAATGSLPVILQTFTMTQALIITVLLGFSSGFGLPSCLAYFADHTSIENRGSIGGITLLITNLSAPLFVVLFGMFDLGTNSIILAAWRVLGACMFFFKAKERNPSGRKKNVSFTSIFHDRSYVLYFVAWIMFCLIDRIEQPILEIYFEEFLMDAYRMVGPLIGSVFMLIAGLLCDRVGRKRVILYGFVALGVAYAVIGIGSRYAPTQLLWYFFLTIESISAGILWVTLILIVWGDLSLPGRREKYYVIGAAPFYATDIMRVLLEDSIGLVPAVTAFSVAGFFLFLAVLPLLYAPETLPEKRIELRQLRDYLDKAKNIMEKSSGRSTED